MASKHSPRRKPTAAKKIADPATVLAAAENAPAVFNISAYFRALYVMRQKGHSWRGLESWVAKFGINVSAVHLRRLYVHENNRLTALSEDELSNQGFPEEMIQEFLRGSDPTRRLTAPDPEDAALVEARRQAALEYGIPREEVDQADLTRPIKLGARTL